jgi:hypothetical protein
MKKEEKWTPHINAAAALVVFIVLGLACASTPKPPKDYVPGIKNLGLSQTEMDLNDPRMPPDRRLGRYWLGTWAPELSEDQVAALLNFGGDDFRIDGNKVERHAGYLYLAPGKHTVTFTYKGIENIRTGPATYEYVTFQVPNVLLEIDMQSGKFYNIGIKQGETARSANHRLSLGSRRVEVNIGFEVNESNQPLRDSISTSGRYDKYLEPYDPSIPVTSQAFLETMGSTYIVGFNGETVRWGYGMGPTVTIGIPPGNHTLQLVSVVDDTLSIYTITANFISGSRYQVGTIAVTNVTRGDRFSTTKTSETFNASAYQTAAPATFDGPSVIVNNNQVLKQSFSHLYISSTTDTTWGPNRLEPRQVIRRGGSVVLPFPISPVNRYDIMMITTDGYRYVGSNLLVTDGGKIDTDSLVSGSQAWH